MSSRITLQSVSSVRYNPYISRYIPLATIHPVQRRTITTAKRNQLYTQDGTVSRHNDILLRNSKQETFLSSSNFSSCPHNSNKIIYSILLIEATKTLRGQTKISILNLLKRAKDLVLKTSRAYLLVIYNLQKHLTPNSNISSLTDFHSNIHLIKVFYHKRDYTLHGENTFLRL